MAQAEPEPGPFRGYTTYSLKFRYCKGRDEDGGADAVDQHEAAEHAAEAEIGGGRVGQVGGADGHEPDQGQGGEEDSEDQAAFLADEVEAHIDHANNEEEEYGAEDKIGDVDEVLREVGPARAVSDM